MYNNENFNICLTENEKLILSLVIHGFRNKEIAQKIKFSESSVKKHISSIIKKTNTHNRTAAIYKLMKNNYIQ